MLFSLTAVRKWNVPWTALKRKLWPNRKFMQYETLPFTYTPSTEQVIQVVSPVMGVALSPHLVTKIPEDQPWSQVFLGTEGLELPLHKSQTHPGIWPLTLSSVTTDRGPVHGFLWSPRLLALAVVVQEGSRAKPYKVGTLLWAPTNETHGLSERLLRRRTPGRELALPPPDVKGSWKQTGQHSNTSLLEPGFTCSWRVSLYSVTSGLQPGIPPSSIWFSLPKGEKK